MEKLKRMVVLLLCAGVSMSLIACGKSGGGKSGSDTSYTMWIYNGSDASYYTDYKDNPAVQYALSKTWGTKAKSVDIEFWVPPGGSEADSYTTMMTSGRYPDILDGVIADPGKNLYEDGIIMDITEHIKQYMPNYMAYIEAHPEFKSNIITNIDGEEKILGIWNANEDYPYQFCGPQYRRDWVVKYGNNPFTGAAFTGGYTSEDPDSWEDDVVFPSGGTDPIYISDWEWMFEIFAKAQEALGITDSYCISMYYPGFTWSGGLCSSFGGGVPVWYIGKDNKVEFGGDSVHFRAYMQCLNTWYKKGWLDKSFNERTSDIFYAIDDTAVRQGRVGMWVGIESELGRRMDVGDALTDGICSYGAAYPINDIYGDDSCKNVIPDCLFTTGLTGHPIYITVAAAGKDIEAILSFFDYFYTEEGALLRTLGLNAEQTAEIDNKYYKKWGLENGAYYIGEDGRYVRSEVVINDGGGLKNAIIAEKLPGITLVTSVDYGYAKSYESSLKKWLQYENTAFFQGSAVTNNMTNEDNKIVDPLRAKILDFLTQKSVDWIKGKTDPYNDSDWDNWCKLLGKYNYQRANEIYQPYVDTYSIK